MLAIGAIVLALAVPAVGGWNARHRVRGAAADLHQHLATAREAAVRREVEVRVCPGDPAAGCLEPPAWERGWFTFEDADADGALGAGEAVLHVRSPLSDVLGSGTRGRPSVRFNALGAAPASNATVTFCDAAGLAGEAHEVRVSNSGRIRRTSSTVPPGSPCPAP